MKKLPPGEWNLGMERTLRSWTNTTHSAMRGIFESSLVVEPLETPLGHNKLKASTGLTEALGTMSTMMLQANAGLTETEGAERTFPNRTTLTLIGTAFGR
ncbi:hypothetical protein V6N12_028512 [Hibiscus sabdariffa]|uniref:Uncharacterized protein n=1 Tax=Hibiscus sabdariffa TaxID=183260 RepID=A0ABR2F625_9ROSI